jgi:chromate transporter
MIPWRQFLLEFARTGNLTIGGGAPMIAELQSRLMQDRRWLPPEDFGLLYGIARLTPGTNILAFIAAMAARMKGWRAGVLAVVVASLPAAAVIWLMTLFFEAWSSNPWVAAAMSGAMAGVVGLIGASAWQLMTPLRDRAIAWLLFCAGFILMSLDLASPLAILLLAAAAGSVWWRE